MIIALIVHQFLIFHIFLKSLLNIIVWSSLKEMYEILAGHLIIKLYPYIVDVLPPKSIFVVIVFHE